MEKKATSNREYAKELSRKAMLSMTYEDHRDAWAAHDEVVRFTKSATVRAQHNHYRNAHDALKGFLQIKASIMMLTVYTRT